ncbi:TssN family type VI secretion system protein [Aquimarina sp. 2201CG5-10]|uniref:TssN family type VI secretion system protein n=1 Tax=Aquimarina callyspongiae TaxID=3098150 RepID=UPI002AB52EFC|nr:TssN family type VI secretion system protein [Aquimarina sp. 2201CG5-10]MDY8138340.1 TssN family type VI secretion system protein [Aquimarina sp. 2201CG5-10]
MNIILQSPVSMDFLKVGIVMLMISALLMGFVVGLKRLFTKNKKKFFLYLIVTLLLFAGTALLSNEKVLNDIPLNSFIGFQIIFLILGCIHVIALRKVFPDLSENFSDFWTEFLYTIVITCLGLITFIMVVGIYKPEYQYIFTASALWFVIPFMVVKLYEFAISIPVSVYKKWFYPIDKKIKDPSDEELQNPLVISFEFNKGKNLDELSNFRLKAPEKMEFGKLFYFFINDYNDRHPEGEIKFLDDKNNPYGWIFYTKPKWYKSQRHIDFTRTIEGNNIREDNIIICQRT